MRINKKYVTSSLAHEGALRGVVSLASLRLLRPLRGCPPQQPPPRAQAARPSAKACTLERAALTEYLLSALILIN